MTSETYIDFCFVRPGKSGFSSTINELLESLFAKRKLNWYLEEKTLDQAEMVVAEIKGMSDWVSEEEAIRYIEENAVDSFWETLLHC